MRTCNKCGWVHFDVTRKFAEAEVKDFNEYFDGLDEAGKGFFGNKKSRIETYEKCFHCGGAWTDFRPFKDGDCPQGCTLQPIIYDIYDE